ncbi:MAG: nitroreductase family protein [Jatrophihabitantaceae bacterium]
MTMIGHRDTGSLSTPATEPWFDSLSQAWHTMTSLRGSLPAPTRQAHSPGLAGAVGILRDALYLPGPSGQRRVPSAGAIFPYTTLVLAHEQHECGAAGWSLFRVSADGRVTDLPADRALTSRLARSFQPAVDERLTHLLVLNRPWMSIRKYGPRGYLYSRLDAAHALVNLLGIALETRDAWLQLSCGGEDTEDLLVDQARYHELCGVVSMRGTDGDTAADGGTAVEVADAVALAGSVDPPDGDTLEAACWSLLGDLVRQGAPRRPAVTVAAPHSTAPAEAEHDLRLAGRWSQASAMRRSTRRFGGPAIEIDRIAAALSALGTQLPTSLQPGGASEIEVTVFVPNALASEAELHRQLGRYGRVVAPKATDRSDITAACMGQQHLREAQAFVLVSASRRRLLYEGRAQFEETLFRAGASGQLMYLGSARAGVGITTVGGFDSARWSEMARLPEDHELLYLAALGNEAASSAPKLDRDAAALTHGER